MNKEFIPYEQALDLKKLGFDELHFGVYGKSEGTLFKVIGDKFDIIDDIHFIKVPLYQQAFKFFREKHNLVGLITTFNSRNNFRYAIYAEYIGVEDYNTYEEAELACLKKLIEIVKNKQ